MTDLDKYSKEFIQHLGKSLVEDLKDSIPKTLETLVDVRFKGVKDGLEPLAQIEAIQREQANMIENLQVSYKHLQTELESLRLKFQNLPEDVKKVNKDTIEKKMDEKQNELLDAVTTQLETTPTKPTKPNIKKRKWYKPWTWFRRGGGK